MSAKEWHLITLKFGGYWSKVKSQNRKRYEGGRQKTLKIDRDMLCFFVLIEEVEEICPWLRGHTYELHYHIYGTSPKEYDLITGDVEVMEMVRLSGESGRTEVVIIAQDGMSLRNVHDNFVDDVICLQRGEVMDDNMLMDFYPSSPESLQNCNSEWCSNTQAAVVPALFIGARFDNKESFKNFLRSKAIEENFGLKITTCDRKRVIAICSHQECPWRIRATLCPDGETFEVRKLEASHSCPGVNRAGNKQATCSWVAHQIEDIVKRYPDVPPKQINSTLETKYGLSLPYMKLWRSREQARSNIFGSVDDSFKWVPALQAELVERNPGSHITFYCDSKDHSFKRFYVCFKVCIDGFLAGCRPLVGLDACHLKSKYLGVLLAANSLDGNNGLFTIAFAVVESESKTTWLWFLQNLLESFGCEIHPLAFISDMEKGLGEAVKLVFPNAEHRVCMRHLWKNIKKMYRCHESSKLQNVVWSAANTLSSNEYNSKVNQMCTISPQIHSYLLTLPYKWSKSQFSSDIKNMYNTNNMSESFNAWVGDAREKPAVELIDMIRGMLMEQRAERKLNSAKWRGDLVPTAEEYIREITTRKEHFIIRKSSALKAEVEGHHERQVVDIEHQECTCKYWQVTGLPCIHATAFIGSLEPHSWDIYVDKLYHVIREGAMEGG